jgi:hypothetical protein
MSDVIAAAVAALSSRFNGFDGVAKFVIPGEGAIMIDAQGVRAGDDEADVTLTAETDVFRAILDGQILTRRWPSCRASWRLTATWGSR